MTKANMSKACVHTMRKELGKDDVTVYGVATDTTHFFFLKLDDNSQVSVSASYQ